MLHKMLQACWRRTLRLGWRGCLVPRPLYSNDSTASAYRCPNKHWPAKQMPAHHQRAGSFSIHACMVHQGMQAEYGDNQIILLVYVASAGHR
jgi:hypothetical protein